MMASHPIYVSWYTSRLVEALAGCSHVRVRGGELVDVLLAVPDGVAGALIDVLAGLEMLVGSVAIAQALGPDEDLARSVRGPVEITVCHTCSLEEEPLRLYELVERAEEERDRLEHAREAIRKAGESVDEETVDVAAKKFEAEMSDEDVAP